MRQGEFGYPLKCTKCEGLNDCILNVSPFYKPNVKTKLILIGQDPTISKKQERVKNVLMLDDKNSQLSRWLRSVFGSEKFEELSIYATNLVKCTFKKRPSEQGGMKFLRHHFKRCKNYLINEILSYQPLLVLTLGETTHKLFKSLFEDTEMVEDRMKNAFTGNFYRVNIRDVKFNYSPCLHITTFRVAETYGQSAINFKEGLKNFLDG